MPRNCSANWYTAYIVPRMSAPVRTTARRRGATLHVASRTDSENDSAAPAVAGRRLCMSADRSPITTVVVAVSSARWTIRGARPSTFSKSEARSRAAAAIGAGSSAPTRIVVAASSTSGAPAGAARPRDGVCAAIAATPNDAVSAAATSSARVFAVHPARTVIIAMLLSPSRRRRDYNWRVFPGNGILPTTGQTSVGEGAFDVAVSFDLSGQVAVARGGEGGNGGGRGGRPGPRRGGGGAATAAGG